MKPLFETLFSSRRRALAAALLGGLTAAAAFAQTPATGAPIRIGMIEGLSGPIANTGDAVFRNLVWATERVNARGGVKLPDGSRPGPCRNTAWVVGLSDPSRNSGVQCSFAAACRKIANT